MKVQQRITDKLNAALSPSFLSVENESGGHNVPAGSETHFKVIAVSEQFDGKRPVQRHQVIYQLLADELKQGVHALALHTFTASEWQDANVEQSPPCLGGGKSV